MTCKGTSQEELMNHVQKIMEERGMKALEMTRKEMLKEEIECKEVREALRYFMTEYWQDFARPALLSLCCEAVGGDPDVTIPLAIPLSLISGGIDIHDDIIDQSDIKRSRPTVLGKFGKDIALLVGDALLFKGLALLNEAVDGIPAEKIPVIIDVIKRMFFELGDAEAIELYFRGRMDVTPEEYLQVVRKKAADVEAHTRIGAILGSKSKKEIEALGEYGRLLGMIIIVGDDLIDMMDQQEMQHRINKEHLPLPILFALQNHKNRYKLSSLISKSELTQKDNKRILEVTQEAEGFKLSENLMKKLAENTYEILEKITYTQNDIKLDLKLLVQSALPPFNERGNAMATKAI